jgi:DNA-binding beta-propeller fold protein YncE
VKTIVAKIDNPCGIAVQPESGDLFIATRPGVYRYNAAAHKVHREITGFPTDIYGKGPKYDIGPLGVAFWGKDRLIVGDGSRPDGSELVRIYKIEAEEDGKPHQPFAEDSAAFTLGPIGPGEQSEKGEGNFYGVVVVGDAIFVTCNGDDTKGWVAKSEIKDGEPGELKPAIATKVATEVDAPGPITATPDGKELVIGQKGEVNVPGDSLLTFYDPKDGSLKRSLKTNLNDIVGLAYSPKTGKLYATDFSWVDAAQGGLFRLDIEGEEVKAEKITSLDKPTGLAFDKDGKLYICIFGTAAEGSKDLPGAVVSIDAGL